MRNYGTTELRTTELRNYELRNCGETISGGTVGVRRQTLSAFVWWMTLSHPETEELTRRIIGAAIEVHRHTGPGLLESTYHECMCLELGDIGLAFRSEPVLPVSYKTHLLTTTYRPDLIVASTVIVEVKAVEKVIDIHKAQVLTYMKHASMKLGFLFNFNSPTLVSGMTRFSL
jgi:GxxExxY protein